MRVGMMPPIRRILARGTGTQAQILRGFLAETTQEYTGFLEWLRRLGGAPCQITDHRRYSS
jgi:hypothetical protein